ncbi:MAG: hypothetical protein R3B07_20130 [Polyangiaceae bacterium]
MQWHGLQIHLPEGWGATRLPRDGLGVAPAAAEGMGQVGFLAECIELSPCGDAEGWERRAFELTLRRLVSGYPCVAALRGDSGPAWEFEYTDGLSRILSCFFPYGSAAIEVACIVPYLDEAVVLSADTAHAIYEALLAQVGLQSHLLHAEAKDAGGEGCDEASWAHNVLRQALSQPCVNKPGSNSTCTC